MKKQYWLKRESVYKEMFDNKLKLTMQANNFDKPRTWSKKDNAQILTLAQELQEKIEELGDVLKKLREERKVWAIDFGRSIDKVLSDELFCLPIKSYWIRREVFDRLIKTIKKTCLKRMHEDHERTLLSLVHAVADNEDEEHMRLPTLSIAQKELIHSILEENHKTVEKLDTEYSWNNISYSIESLTKIRFELQNPDVLLYIGQYIRQDRNQGDLRKILTEWDEKAAFLNIKRIMNSWKQYDPTKEHRVFDYQLFAKREQGQITGYTVKENCTPKELLKIIYEGMSLEQITQHLSKESMTLIHILKRYDTKALPEWSYVFYSVIGWQITAIPLSKMDPLYKGQREPFSWGPWWNWFSFKPVNSHFTKWYKGIEEFLRLNIEDILLWDVYRHEQTFDDQLIKKGTTLLMRSPTEMLIEWQDE